MIGLIELFNPFVFVDIYNMSSIHPFKGLFFPPIFTLLKPVKLSTYWLCTTNKESLIWSAIPLQTDTNIGFKVQI